MSNKNHSGNIVEQSAVNIDSAEVSASESSSSVKSSVESRAETSSAETAGAEVSSVVSTVEVSTAETSEASLAFLARLADTLECGLPANGGDPQGSYVAKLYSKAPDGFLKKVGEEATELVMACKDQDTQKIIAETADLWFHSMVALSYYGLRPEQVVQELARREGVSGLEEKASRPKD